jgi:Asp-tRNA(Asn)/Glu-tRNA(Gln) amidotransferase A subunit family amidase
MTDQWTKARAAANLKAHEAYYAAVEHDGVISQASSAAAVDAALSALREHGWEVRKITAKDIMQESALRTARNEALEEAAVEVAAYEGSRFGQTADHHEISCWLREFKHKDGQP